MTKVDQPKFQDTVDDKHIKWSVVVPRLPKMKVCVLHFKDEFLCISLEFYYIEKNLIENDI